MQPEKLRILDEIRAAFPAAPIQADGAFTQWGTSYPDARSYREQLDGKTWEQLDRTSLVRRSDALGFLGTQQLVAVLPAYLSALIEEGVWSPAAGILTLILAEPHPGSDAGLGQARFSSLVEALSDAQRKVIATVLRAFAKADEGGSLGDAAREAFEGHWQLYLPAATRD